METRTTCTARSPASTRQYFKVALIAALGVVIAVGAPARATAPIVATGDPATDFGAIQNALDAGGEVILQNGPNGEVFNLEGVEKSLSITRDVTLKGQDDVAGNMARVVANNFTTQYVEMYDDIFTLAIEVNLPGGTVAFDNLDMESGDNWLVRLYDCRDIRFTNCKIKGTKTGSTAVLVTLEGITGRGYFEGNNIDCPWGVVDGNWFRTEFPTYEFYSNTMVCPTNTCIVLKAASRVTIENNRFEAPSPVYLPGICGEITIKNNTVIQSGYSEYPPGSDVYSASAIYASHLEGFRGGEISGNTIEINPSENVQMDFVPSICLADFEAFGGAQDLLVQDNIIAGKADWGIFLYNGASGNVIRRNNLENFTAVQFTLNGAGQIGLGLGCHDNTVRGNIVGPLGTGALAAIWCSGDDNNDFIRNDYTRSGIQGLAAGGKPCVWLANVYDAETSDLVSAPENNLVFETLFPTGTDAVAQVLDDPRELTGTTTNIVVGR
ncbi:right-handed parallel beta-helix repeat-containing protein [Planctomycetota bacterium]